MEGALGSARGDSPKRLMLGAEPFSPIGLRPHVESKQFGNLKQAQAEACGYRVGWNLIIFNLQFAMKGRDSPDRVGISPPIRR
jgi:hypothetical protein